MHETPIEDFDRLMRLNLRPTYLTTHAAVPDMIEAGAGSIVDVSAKAAFRAAKVTGLQNLPSHGSDQNPIWLALVQLASELIAWMQILALTDILARRWEPKRLRLRLLSIAGSVARHARLVRLRLAATAPGVGVLMAGLHRFETCLYASDLHISASSRRRTLNFEPWARRHPTLLGSRSWTRRIRGLHINPNHSSRHVIRTKDEVSHLKLPLSLRRRPL